MIPAKTILFMSIISPKTVLLLSLAYFALLFLIAYYAEKCRKKGNCLLKNSHIYSLSLAVYCTSWTFYGSVGKAATSGLEFLPIYLGPTLIAFAWWFLLRKMLIISKQQNITSLADFLSSRYDRSTVLGAIVTLFAVFGITPYIALQLKAIAQTLKILSMPLTTPGAGLYDYTSKLPWSIDIAFFVALLLALFGMLFGARSLDSSEKHEGLVVAVAFESIVKLIAFLAVGIFVTYGLFDGFIDVFQRFAEQFPERRDMLLLGTQQTPYTKWFTLIVLSMMAVMFLPRQFHIMVTENTDEQHIKSAMWKFPAYLFLMNLFVLPIALGGLIINGGDTSQADYFVLTLPLASGHPWLALLVFIGGLSASAGMVMVSSVTIATMVLNHLIMPIILRMNILSQNLSKILINIKRLGILAVIFIGYFYFKVIGDSYALVNMGLISFAAVTQFAPAIIGGLFWKRANSKAAITAITLGFTLWFYTLLIPSFVRSGWISADILQNGPYGIGLLKPLELFGLRGFDIYTHSLFWSMLFNLAAYLAISFFSKQTSSEEVQAKKFVDVFVEQSQQPNKLKRISKAPTVMEFVELMSKFIGAKPAQTAITEYLSHQEIDSRGNLSDHEIPNLKSFTEKTLAGHVGAAPARIILENYLEARGSEMEDVFDIFGTVTISHASSREQLSVLYEAAQIVSSEQNFQKTLDSILELLAQQFKFDLCVIRFLEPESMTLIVKSLVGVSSEHFGQFERNLNMETYIGQAFLSNATTVVNDTDATDKPASAEHIKRDGITCLAHTPIVFEGEPIGILSAFSKSAKGIFTQEFIALFENLAGQIGIAWRNDQQLQKLLVGREQEKEMQIAKDIQKGLLPANLPKTENVEIAGLCVPAHQVGGDYYDFIEHNSSSCDLIIADVSGHNIGSALIMAEARTFIHARIDSVKQPTEMLQELNHFFLKDLDRSDLFVTMFYLQYNYITHQLTYGNAGHNTPLLWRKRDQKLETLDAEGLIFGIKDKIAFEQKIIDLEAGDLLLLYTDGIIEAENKEKQFFGIERLGKLLEECDDLSCQELVDRIMIQGRIFTGMRHFNDDITLVAMKILK
ncbi:serine phosphatase [Desulfuromusa kysingii]|uniref:Serine phosphatase n=1 Tax=Desulfuromusa kysingii TaxID=37625 RepID=A0A1H3YDM4_9BACT|nr:SpoIIE family protein phosphatase [Desulfuromusa kysingii]SEA09687.1 serine phosphatase [Desulfuromusa kysingii]